MKDVMILTGISLRRNPERSLKKTWARIKKNSLGAGVAFGVISFLGILLDFCLFGSVMGLVSLVSLWISEEGGLK